MYLSHWPFGRVQGRARKIHGAQVLADYLAVSGGHSYRVFVFAKPRPHAINGARSVDHCCSFGLRIDRVDAAEGERV